VGAALLRGCLFYGSQVRAASPLIANVEERPPVGIRSARKTLQWRVFSDEWE
jgi:hypothetical protein